MATALFIPLKERLIISNKLHTHPCQTQPHRPLHYRHWEADKIGRALGAVHSGMKIRQAAEEYGIPCSTLHDYYSGKVLPGSRSGPKPYLDSLEESELANFLVDSSLIGYSRTPKQIIEMVQHVVDKKGLGVVVSNSWWKSFCSRHTELSRSFDTCA